MGILQTAISLQNDCETYETEKKTEKKTWIDSLHRWRAAFWFWSDNQVA